MGQMAKSAPPRLSHGLSRGRDFWLLPGEDADRWRTFRESVVANLAPVGPLEAETVERLAELYWRRQRIAVQEQSLATLATPRLVKALVTAPPKPSLYQEQTPQRDPEGPLPVAEVVELEVQQGRIRETGQSAYERHTWQSVAMEDPTIRRSQTANPETGKLEPVTVSPEQQAHYQAEADRRGGLEAARSARLAEHTKAATMAGVFLGSGPADLLARYETHLDRSIRRTLEELEKLRTLRAG